MSCIGFFLLVRNTQIAILLRYDMILLSNKHDIFFFNSRTSVRLSNNPLHNFAHACNWNKNEFKHLLFEDFHTWMSYYSITTVNYHWITIPFLQLIRRIPGELSSINANCKRYGSYINNSYATLWDLVVTNVAYILVTEFFVNIIKIRSDGFVSLNT